MALLIKDFVKIIEKKIPINLKEEWDNVGLMVGNEDMEITSILVSLDCTSEVITEAIEKGCNLILTHHPLIFHGLSTITNQDKLGSKIYTLINNNIAVYSAHTNLDKLKGGLNDILCSLLEFKDSKVMDSFEDNTGIGRLVELSEGVTLLSLMKHINNKLSLTCIRYTGDKARVIKKLAIINGSGADYFDVFYKSGAECIITGDTKHHQVLDYKELNVSIIDIGHFESEWLPFKIFCEGLKAPLSGSKVLFSENSLSPYNYFKNL
ncbi:MAG TPA: Nif3-like dinuclear metal center hexameric protein [Clostridiaceae bacterium]